MKNITYFDCKCTDLNHSVKLAIVENNMWIEVFDVQIPFFKRLWKALLYVFCVKTHNTIYLSKNDQEKIVNLFKQFTEKSNFDQRVLITNPLLCKSKTCKIFREKNSNYCETHKPKLSYLCKTQ